MLVTYINRFCVYQSILGPTNSGKTYEALQRFKASKSGVYCGPLRLLAAEVFRRMNAEGGLFITLYLHQEALWADNFYISIGNRV